MADGERFRVDPCDGERVKFGLDLAFSGPETGACLVMGNALGTDRRLWSEQEQALASGLRIIRFDYPGHGGSDDRAYLSCEELAHDLLRALDAHRVARFFYCGISMGSAIGLSLACIAPERLSGLVLSNGAARFGTEGLWTERIAQAEAHGVASLADAAVARWLPAEMASRDLAKAAELRKMFSATSLHGYTQACGAVRDFDARGYLASIDLPTLIVAGSLDVATTPAQALELHRGIRASRYLELPAAHLANMGCPAEFTTALKEFITSTSQA